VAPRNDLLPGEVVIKPAYQFPEPDPDAPAPAVIPATSGSGLTEARRRILREIASGSTGTAGLLTPGNIDLKNRPRVKNADGTISTVRSISVGIDGKEVLIPTVSPQGRILTDQQAIDLYRKTGKHLGIFTDPDTATAYAKQLHEQQAKLLQPAQPPTPAPSGLSDARRAILRAVAAGTTFPASPAQPSQPAPAPAPPAAPVPPNTAGLTPLQKAKALNQWSADQVKMTQRVGPPMGPPISRADPRQLAYAQEQLARKKAGLPTFAELEHPTDAAYNQQRNERLQHPGPQVPAFYEDQGPGKPPKPVDVAPPQWVKSAAGFFMPPALHQWATTPHKQGDTSFEVALAKDLLLMQAAGVVGKTAEGVLNITPWGKKWLASMADAPKLKAFLMRRLNPAGLAGASLGATGFQAGANVMTGQPVGEGFGQAALIGPAAHVVHGAVTEGLDVTAKAAADLSRDVNTLRNAAKAASDAGDAYEARRLLRLAKAKAVAQRAIEAERNPRLDAATANARQMLEAELANPARPRPTFQPPQPEAAAPAAQPTVRSGPDRSPAVRGGLARPPEVQAEIDAIRAQGRGVGPAVGPEPAPLPTKTVAAPPTAEDMERDLEASTRPRVVTRTAVAPAPAPEPAPTPVDEAPTPKTPVVPSPAPAPAAVKPPQPSSQEYGITRSYRAGSNSGMVQFQDDIHRDLYDLGAKQRYLTRGGQNKPSDRTLGDIQGLTNSLKSRLGMDQAQVRQLGLDVHDDVRTQMKGLKDGETRTVTNNVLKPETVPPAAPTTTAPEVPTAADRIRAKGEQLKASGQARLDKLRAKPGERFGDTESFSANLNPEELQAYAEIGAGHLLTGGADAADWARAMVKEHGEGILPHLKEIRSAAVAHYNEVRKTDPELPELSVARPPREAPAEATTKPATVPEPVAGTKAQTEAPKPAAGPPAAPEAKTAAVTVTAEKPEGQSIQNRATKILREGWGLDELPKPERQKMRDWAQGAVDGGYQDRAEKIAREVLDDPKSKRTLTEEEGLGIAMRLDELENRRSSLAKEVEVQKGKDGEQATVDRYVEVQSEMDTLTDAANQAGTRQARAFVARRAFAKDRYGYTGQYATMRKALDRPLNAAEEKRLSDAVAAHAEAEKQAQQYQQENDDLKRQVAESKAQVEVDKQQASLSRAPKSESAEAKIARIRQNRETALASAKAKLAASAKRETTLRADPLMGGGTLLAEAAHQAQRFAEIAPEVRQIAQSIVEEGVVRAGEVAKRTAEFFQSNGVDMTADEALAVIGGRVTSQAEQARVKTQWQQVKAEASKSFVDANDEIRRNTQTAKTEAARQEREVAGAKRRWTREEAARKREGLKKAKKALAEAQRAYEKGELDKARAARDEYQQWWKESTGGQETKFLNDIDRLGTRINQMKPEFVGPQAPGRTPESVPTDDPKLYQLWMKRERMRMDLDRLQQEAKRKAEWEKEPPEIKSWKWFSDAVFGVTRSIEASGDIQSPFNQGGQTVWSDPAVWSKSFVGMLRAAGEAGYENAGAAMRIDPMFDKAKVGGVRLPLIDPSISGEENLISTKLENVPIVGHNLKFSRNTYDANVSLMRFGMFKSWVGWAEKMKGGELSPQGLKVIGNAVNSFTGGGAKWVGQAGPIAKPFFALRNTMSNIEFAFGKDVFTSYYHARTTGEWEPFKVILAKQSAAWAGQFAALGAMSAALAYEQKASERDDARIEMNPMNTDFGRLVIKRGHSTVAIPLASPGLAMWANVSRLAGVSLLAMSKISTSGKKTQGEEAGSLGWGRFLTQRLNPILSEAALLTAAATKKDHQVFGKSYDLTTTQGKWNALLHFAPFSSQDVTDTLTSKDLTPKEKFTFAILSAGKNVNVRQNTPARQNTGGEEVYR
jgi:hypothetical protein